MGFANTGHRNLGLSFAYWGILSVGALILSLSPPFSLSETLLPEKEEDSKKTRREADLAILPLLALTSELRAHKEKIYLLIFWRV